MPKPFVGIKLIKQAMDTGECPNCTRVLRDKRDIVGIRVHIEACVAVAYVPKGMKTKGQH